MRSAIVAAALSCGLIPSLAHAARQVVTPSGQPDAMFRGAPLQDATSKVVNQCMNKGWAVASQSTNQVVCEVPVGAMKAAFQQMLLGNSYSTTPRTFARFTVAQVGDSSRVQAAAWVETQMAFGQVRQQPYTDDETFNGLQGFLLEAGGELPPGSRITGVYIGFNGEPQAEGKKIVLPVTSVTAGSPGALAGLQVGDRVLKLNGQPFKNFEDFKKKLNKVGAGVRFPLEIERAGKAQTLTVVAAEFPMVGSPEWTALQREGAASTTSPEAAIP